MKLLAILSALPFLAAAEDLVWCGNARYYPSKYTCFDGFLCPKTNGEVYLKCGTACYSTRTYYCDSNQQLQIYKPGPEPILYCGGQPYYPSKYACYDTNFLCPILNGSPTLRCDKACYNPNEYSCVNGKLSKPT
ncbi:carbohydrate-binding module family 52 protein [Trematosphaeria pertusa]|uniref:Carbohydrate-binding module family 52 protein n=1 Tax=Trematosphaeria pertusa TaxID=390896 RepID=A0A6A6I6E1_9PLEO|nr:carbohydrate-binding module family 52 protein [Trematosphaeria pertusa]KAF2245512.1 carbohydrate-binding module family 52 protein [Trematosphaeria pertusa]